MTDCYINDNLLVQGSQTPLWDKPSYLSNSQLTNTTSRLSQTSLYSPDNYRPLRRSYHQQQQPHPRDSVEDWSSRNGSASSSLDLAMEGASDGNMKKSVSFNKKYSMGVPSSTSVTQQVGPHYNGTGRTLSSSSTNGFMMNTNSSTLTPGGSMSAMIMNGALNGDHYQSSGQSQSESGQSDTGSNTSGLYRKEKEQANWYTRPVHLARKDYANLGDFHHHHVTLPSSPPMVSPVGEYSHHSVPMAWDSNSSTDKMDVSSPTPPMSPKQENNEFHVARDFFPVTLGAAYELQAIDPMASKTFSPPAKGLPKPNNAPWKPPKRSRSPSRKSRPGSAHSSSSSNSKSSVDRLYLMSAEAPNINTATVLLSSPYQQELAKLRMERLKYEEEHLLEVKRKDELERIRGPKPKWYEMRTPQFHYEAHKNNQLNKSKNSYQDLLDYRGELELASKEFTKKLSSQQQNGKS